MHDVVELQSMLSQELAHTIFGLECLANSVLAPSNANLFSGEVKPETQQKVKHARKGLLPAWWVDRRPAEVEGPGMEQEDNCARAAQDASDFGYCLLHSHVGEDGATDDVVDRFSRKRDCLGGGTDPGDGIAVGVQLASQQDRLQIEVDTEIVVEIPA